MAASVNKVILIGNLGQDPEVRSFANGGQIANLRIATTEQWKDRQTGERKEHTEWHSVVLNDRLAEVAGQYLRKGSAVYIEGSLRTRKWQDQNGNDRYSTEIRGLGLQMLGGRPSGSSDGYGGAQQGSGNPYGDSAPAPRNAAPAAPAYGNNAPPAASRQPQNSAPQQPAAPAFDSFEDDDIPF